MKMLSQLDFISANVHLHSFNTVGPTSIKSSPNKLKHKGERRGEKAFCSAECRCKQILIDEQNEKCHTEARKPIDCSASACSGASHFIAGVAAA